MIQNSISTTLQEILAQSANSQNIYKGIERAITTKSDNAVTVTITRNDNPNETETIQVPSFGYLSNAIARLENNLRTITNVTDGSGSMVRLNDGSYRKIIAAKVPSEAPTITKANGVTNFAFRSNWFFEDLINPLLYVNFDVTGQILVSTKQVQIERYLLSCTTDEQLQWFKTLQQRSGAIEYSTFLYELIQQKCTYVLDDEIKDMPVREKRYIGNFSVQHINNIELKEIINNVDTTRYVTEYVLNTLNYTDILQGVEYGKTLSVGDYIEVASYPTTTRYQITAIDNARSAVQVKLTEGFELIEIGENVLKISDIRDDNQDGVADDVPLNVEIAIGYNEYCVCFVKAIDPDSSIAATNWSPGIAFYTNSLTYTNAKGQLEELSTFYQKNVVDIGQILLAYSDDHYPSIREAVVPDAPTLDSSDFKVVQINKQITDTDVSEKISKLISEKLQLQQSIDNNTNSIASLNEKQRTTNYLSSQDRLNDENELQNLITTRDTNSVSYSSVVNQIQSIYTSDSASKLPKYHVRGFWAMPEEKVGPSGNQSIIKFKYRYRYLSENGNANNSEEFTYTEGETSTKSKAIFSNWELGETQLRDRRQNNSTGLWYWADVTNTDLESIDINQLDIAINKGEQVEIQVRSISEAGYPANPVESDWSNSVVVSFPANLTTNGIDGIIEQNKQDLARVELQKEMNAMGVRSHVGDSFATNDKYFAHSATSIASGFLSPEQSPITLFDKLYDLQSQVTSLIEQINQVQGQVKVELLDEDGGITELIEGGTTIVSAGYYEEWVNTNITTSKTIVTNQIISGSTSGSGMPYTILNKAGAIMSKTFNIKITNTNQSGLMLLSKLPGSRLSMTPNTIKNARKIASNDEYITGNFAFRYDLYDNIISDLEYDNDYYQEIGRYDLVPINLQGSGYKDFQLASQNMYQSAQARGQYIYARFRDISDTFNLYANRGSKDYKSETGVYHKIDSVGVYDEQSDLMFSELFGCRRQAYPAVIGDTYYSLKGLTLVSTPEDDIDRKGFTFTVNETFSGGFFTDKPAHTMTILQGDYLSQDYVRYNNLTGSNLTSRPIDNSVDKDTPIIKDYIEFTPIEDQSFYPFNYALYRIPRTYQRPTSGIASAIKGGKMSVRISSMNQSASDLQKYLQRIQKVQSNVATKQFEIEPRIQTAYGFGDLDYLADTGGDSDIDDHQYLTTHKIGFLPNDQFIQNSGGFRDMGFNTCNSYLFLSPISHEEIQVNGDTRNAYKEIPYGEQHALYVPLVYQARMTTYPTYSMNDETDSKGIKEDAPEIGIIFGDKANTKFSKSVQNTYFSNIIGLDIWVDRNTPRQYDLIVYSKYSRSTTSVDKDNRKSQALVDSMKDLTGNIQILAKNSTKSRVV